MDPGSNDRQRRIVRRLQRGRTYFFRGEPGKKSNESLDGGSVASDRQRHFLRVPRFPFFPVAAFARGGTQLRYTMGQFARTKFNFLRPIDFFLLPFFLSSFFSSFFFFFVMELRERGGGGREGSFLQRKKEELRKKGRGESKVGSW